MADRNRITAPAKELYLSSPLTQALAQASVTNPNAWGHEVFSRMQDVNNQQAYDNALQGANRLEQALAMRDQNVDLAKTLASQIAPMTTAGLNAGSVISQFETGDIVQPRAEVFAPATQVNLGNTASASFKQYAEGQKALGEADQQATNLDDLLKRDVGNLNITPYVTVENQAKLIDAQTGGSNNKAYYTEQVVDGDKLITQRIPGIRPEGTGPATAGAPNTAGTNPAAVPSVPQNTAKQYYEAQASKQGALTVTKQLPNGDMLVEISKNGKVMQRIMLDRNGQPKRQ
jgi:hypothetical protein